MEWIRTILFSFQSLWKSTIHSFRRNWSSVFGSRQVRKPPQVAGVAAQHAHRRRPLRNGAEGLGGEGEEGELAVRPDEPVLAAEPNGWNLQLRWNHETSAEDLESLV